MNMGKEAGISVSELWWKQENVRLKDLNGGRKCIPVPKGRKIAAGRARMCLVLPAELYDFHRENRKISDIYFKVSVSLHE